jgi:hypothetical protein
MSPLSAGGHPFPENPAAFLSIQGQLHDTIPVTAVGALFDRIVLAGSSGKLHEWNRGTCCAVAEDS